MQFFLGGDCNHFNYILFVKKDRLEKQTMNAHSLTVFDQGKFVLALFSVHVSQTVQRHSDLWLFMFIAARGPLYTRPVLRETTRGIRPGRVRTGLVLRTHEPCRTR
jgi:hypothetical protein